MLLLVAEINLAIGYMPSASIYRVTISGSLNTISMNIITQLFLLK